MPCAFVTQEPLAYLRSFLRRHVGGSGEAPPVDPAHAHIFRCDPPARGERGREVR